MSLNVFRAFLSSFSFISDFLLKSPEVTDVRRTEKSFYRLLPAGHKTMYGVCIMYVLRDHQRNTVKAVCLFFWVRLKGYRRCEPGTVTSLKTCVTVARI